MNRRTFLKSIAQTAAATTYLTAVAANTVPVKQEKPKITSYTGDFTIHADPAYEESRTICIILQKGDTYTDHEGRIFVWTKCKWVQNPNSKK